MYPTSFCTPFHIFFCVSLIFIAKLCSIRLIFLLRRPLKEEDERKLEGGMEIEENPIKLRAFYSPSFTFSLHFLLKVCINKFEVSLLYSLYKKANDHCNVRHSWWRWKSNLKLWFFILEILLAPAMNQQRIKSS